MLKDIKIESIEENDNPRFIKTEKIKYTREGYEAYWERIKSMDSVHILVYNIDTEKFLLVKQYRIPVLVNNPDNTGVIECCAGLMDKFPEITNQTERSTKIAKEEVLEELGYDVDESDFIYIGKHFTGVGSSGNSNYLFYVEVKNKDFSGKQLGEQEDIITVELSKESVFDFIENEESTDSVTKYLLTRGIASKNYL